MNKKTNPNFTIALVLSVGLISCGSGENPMNNANNLKALQEIKQDPNVVEAILTDVDVIYIGVADNKKNKNFWAETFCDVLKKHNATTKRIKVVQSGSTQNPNRDNAYGILLGEAQCI